MDQPYQLICNNCKTTMDTSENITHCHQCEGLLEYAFNSEYLKTVKFRGANNFWRYRSVLPKVTKTVSLGEGGTPLQRSHRLAEELGLNNLYLKDETRNPTSSFKDRSASLIISDAVSRGYDSIVCASNGNHGASVAAYSAREDLNCNLIVPRAIDLGKLAQMMVYNAKIIEAGESIESAISRAQALENELGWYQATTELNPLSIEALKTIAYELVEQQGSPDWVAVAMGSGTTMHAIWKGFKELKESGRITDTPKLIGVQAKGCSPITDAFSKGIQQPISIVETRTEASAIRVATPIYGKLAIQALQESNGVAISISDEEMISTGKLIAKLEGIFPEPASAATVACLKPLVEQKLVGSSDIIVSLITSSGLKTDDILQTITKRKKSPRIGSRLATKEKILRIISDEATYGYSIWRNLGTEMTIGAVYQHLTDLEEKGLIQATVKGKRKIMTITERGKKALKALNDLQVLL
jgi:threonine synthase